MTRPIDDGGAVAWVDEQLALHTMSRVRPDMARAGGLVNQARSHVRSVEMVVDTDVTFALAGCHDAVRKAIDAHAGAAGLRIENRQGHHQRVLEYAGHHLGTVISRADLEEADRLRRRRHSTEYGEIPAGAVTAAEVRSYAATAARIVDAVARSLAGTQPAPPTEGQAG